MIIKNTSSESNQYFSSTGMSFLLAYVPCVVIFLTPSVSAWVNEFSLTAGLPLFVFFVVIPLLDEWIGHGDQLFRVDDQQLLSSVSFYQLLLLLAVPVQLYMIYWAGVYYASGQLGLAGGALWVISTGLVSAGLGITVAHELIHKNGWLLPVSGGILLSSVCYPGFKIEHIRGHHVNVATPQDPTTAKFEQSLFHFLPRAIYHNVRQAFVLEARRLHHKGYPAWHWKNEMLWWWALSVLFSVAMYGLLGLGGLMFFLGQSFIAILTLETINYVEHYGLERRKKETGRYERVGPEHSWNSNYVLSNLMLFQLQRHSDHHARPKVLYPELKPCQDVPQLPFGYPAMLLMAWFPALWFHVMNPRVKRWREHCE